MPPKARTPVTILKFKRSRSTYSIPLILDKKSLNQETFITALTNAINSTGGLRIVDNLDPEEEGIPPPEEEGVEVSAEDISLALPKDRNAPHENNWFPVEEDKQLEDLVFNDYDYIAFKFADDSGFHIEESEFGDQQE
ncbi:uncharacterized protein CXQ87_000306 [Candidozyma duobushaemuli]|uniref:Uncharacterized protein n=2 Tax=Candidozyma TaxID=3303203 RepID=A0ABX8HZU4_9ASCO|nr:uncharacterized protein CXQ87_000306 [[Candida] duobushaemulonis]PVH17421.1 hypothetical protein CXQ87_000306 [[Candida] duobushaemulonis]QWU86062.1 hypothetical protein CA3LBN_000280 [[Candida] haemuloni]